MPHHSGAEIQYAAVGICNFTEYLDGEVTITDFASLGIRQLKLRILKILNPLPGGNRRVVKWFENKINLTVETFPIPERNLTRDVF